MAITQTIATLPAVLNDSATFYEDIAIRNNSLVTVSFPSINTWATQANALAVEVNDKAAQVAAQAVDGGYSQTYINTNFVGVNNAQTIAGIKTFSSNPLSTATQSTNANALTKYSAVVKNSGDETIAGIKTFSSTISGSINGNASTVTNGVYTTGAQTIAGVKTFSTSPIVPTPTTTGNVITMDNIIQKTAVGIGYGTGAGGTVTQLTSKSTAVTLNKPSGTITMNNAALAAGASARFLVLNNLVNILDTVSWSFKDTTVTDQSCNVWISSTGGGFYVNIKNISGGSLSEAVSINFTVIKGANS